MAQAAAVGNPMAAGGGGGGSGSQSTAASVSPEVCAKRPEHWVGGAARCGCLAAAGERKRASGEEHVIGLRNKLARV